MESKVSTHIFVYNTLRSGFHKIAYKYISDYFIFIDTGKIHGVLNDVHGEPLATPSDVSFIHGELYKLKESSDFSYVFGQLDDYEGVDTEADETPKYRREIIKVYTDKGGVTEAWIYWYNGDLHGYPVITSGNTVEYYGEENF